MKQRLMVSAMVSVLILLTGCQTHLSQNGSENMPAETRTPVRYQIAINRTTTVYMKNDSGENTPQTMTEALTANLSLWRDNAIQNQITFKAVCDSVHMLRYDFVKTASGVEALRQLDGKGFSLTISPKGDMADDSSIKTLMKLAAKDSGQKTCKGAFKEPDMLIDFYIVAADLCAAAAKASYSQGQTWSRLEPTPTPAVEFSLPQRQITCTVNQLVNQDGIRKAKMTEVHTLAEDGQTESSGIYPELIKTSGLFSSLRRWRTQSIDGTGEKVINLETGFLESSIQHWQVKAVAGFAIPISSTPPVITIDEKIAVKQIQ
jgi:hypothetical protein